MGGGRIRKIVQKFLARPPEVSFEDVRLLLEAFDFTDKCHGSSHHVFRHADGRLISVPTVNGRRVKGFYVKEIVNLLKLEEWDANQDD
jgi:predicted RNA binding protein YcfA (HicA-like mRNA interferase family)